MQIGPFLSRGVRETTDEFLQNGLSLHALALIVQRFCAPHATSFEQYVAMALHDAGVDELSKRKGGQPLRIDVDNDGRRIHLAGSNREDPAVAQTAPFVEDALNRLAFVADALEDAALIAQAAARPRVSISWTGVDRSPATFAMRHATIELPPLSPTEQPALTYFNEIDWRVIEGIANDGRRVFQSSLRPNMRQSMLGAYAPCGSDWDVRTRLSALVQTITLPFSFDCRFDCDVEQARACIIMTVPSLLALPRKNRPDQLALTALTTEERDSAHMAYALRLACLAACACFGAGRHLEQAHVVIEDGESSLVRCAFSRDAFVRTVLAAIDDGSLSNPVFRFDPHSLIRLISPDWIAYKSEKIAGESGTRPPQFCSGPNRTPPEQDDRPLSEQLEMLFFAKRICDIDTSSYYGHGADIVDSARLESRESVLAAVAQLESLADELGRDISAPHDDADARALYCANPFARLAISLVCDELSIGGEAQSYAWEHDIVGNASESSDSRLARPHRENCGMPTFFRAPDALFNAHLGLSDLYQRLGDFAGAIAHADYCIRLAPTSAAAYFRKADVLGQQTLYAQAANVLISGLHCSISKRDCSLLYYHLALLLWKLDRKDDAAAVLVYTSSLVGEFAQRARATLKSLRTRKDSPVLVHASPLAAARTMARSRIPVTPTDEAWALIAQAAIGLSCANAPRAAAPYAEALADHLRNDDVIASACHSLCKGL